MTDGLSHDHMQVNSFGLAACLTIMCCGIIISKSKPSESVVLGVILFVFGLLISFIQSEQVIDDS